MANRVVLLTSLLSLTWVLIAQWPIGVQGSREVQCGSSAPPAVCNPSDPIRNLWNVSITDCSTPDAVTVHIVDDLSADRSNFMDQNLLEVRLNCTDGNAQTEVSVACSDRFSGLGYVTFSNLSAFGIQPGWTCSISGCFTLTGFGDSTYVHTPNDSCILPTESDDIATTTPTPMVTTINSTEVDVDMPATNSTEVPTTEANATTVSGVDITDFQMERNLLLIPIVLVPVFVVLLLLITIVLLMILLLSWLKQQKARKMALLVFDQQNMIFDPGYSPGVCIDKPSFAHAHRTSMVSNTDYLQYLTSMDTKPQLQFPGDIQVTFENNYTKSSILPRTSFSHESSTNNSKQHNNSVGTTKDMDGCPKEFPGSGGYVLDEHSDGLREGFHSPSDNASELTVTLSCGGCQSSGYILNTQGNSSFVQNENNTNSESLSDDSLSLLLPDDNSARAEPGVIGLDHNGHPPSSSSDAGYVEQSITLPNESLNNIMLIKDSDVFELDLELTDGQCDGYQPQYPSSNATSLINQQTAGYVTDLQNTHQVRRDHQEPEVACLDNFDCSVDESACTQHSQLDTPCLTSTDGYILNEHLTPTAVTTMRDTESLELSITIDDEQSLSQLNDLPSSSLSDHSVNVRSLDAPSTSDKSSSRGYITTEDIDMTEFTSREIVVPASEISPSQIEPGFTVRLDFDDETKLCKDQMKDQLGYVCNSHYSGMESEQNVNAQNDMDHSQLSTCLDESNQAFNSNGYVASELEQPPISGTEGKEQYVSYDFHSMASELGDSHLDFTTVTPNPAHVISDSVCQSPVCLHVQPQSNYYPASDVSSGYLSGSTTSSDTSVYLGMDKLRQVDHNLQLY